MKPAPTSIIALVYFLMCFGSAQTEVFIRVSPSRRQFFKYEPISLSCEGDTAQNWTVTRRDSWRDGTCGTEWRDPEGETCTILTAYPLDSGAYWCESTSGEQRHSISLNISDGHVILESPVRPVPEGNEATFRCLSKDQTGQPSSDLPAVFYRNGSFFRTEPTGLMTIRRVGKIDKGSYKCSIPGRGESPESWVEVTDSYSAEPAEPGITLTHLIVKMLVFIPYLISTFLYFSIRKDRARARAAAAAAANGRRRRRADDVNMEAGAAAAANGRRRRHANDVIMEVAV